MQLRCFVGPLSADGRFFIGYSEDISRSGLLIRLGPPDPETALPMPGDDIEVDLELPPNRAFKQVRSLCCRATVVSIRNSVSGATYLAAAVHQMQFRDLPARFLQPEWAGFLSKVM
ncbi:MAG: PilZ domain-containing protein [Bryobacterales bacterium]|nr:PilZ domain-containing protein [Bryobacterales bacterium]